ncbi:MAG TPA: hypothetical protein VMX74_13355 [Pirellulales bacterium]|nr:hypothetical protein [Pirellulales bacterium]
MVEHDKNYYEQNDGSEDQLAADRMAMDLLVDGEMEEEQRKQLLSALDYTPDGWRQLALAFVEAQTLRLELGAMIDQPEGVSIKENSIQGSSVQRAAVTPRPSFWSRRAVVILATAASFLVALSLGLLLRPGKSPSGAGAMIASPVDQLNSEPIARSATRGSIPAVVGQEVPPNDVERSVSVDDDNLFLSVREGQTDEDVWSHVKTSALPPHIRKLLEQLGHRVEVRRTEVTRGLPDGRRVTVPVEEFDVQFVGDVEYQ